MHQLPRVQQESGVGPRCGTLDHSQLALQFMVEHQRQSPPDQVVTRPAGACLPHHARTRQADSRTFAPVPDGAEPAACCPGQADRIASRRIRRSAPPETSQAMGGAENGSGMSGWRSGTEERGTGLLMQSSAAAAAEARIPVDLLLSLTSSRVARASSARTVPILMLLPPRPLLRRKF